MTTAQTTAGTAADGYRVQPQPIPRPRPGDDPTEPGRRARHRAPEPLRNPSRWLRAVAIADGGLLALSLTVALAAGLAPHPSQPRAAALPTMVEMPREPTGHGGPIGPVAGPSFAADVPVWTEDKGAVIVNGQALPTSTVVRAPVVTEAALEPTPPAVTPTVAAASTPAATPTPTPVVEPTDEPEVTEPVQTTPTETTEPTDPTVTVGLAEITVAVLP